MLKPTDSTKWNLRISGVLFILATVASIAGMTILQSHISGPEFIGSLFGKRTQVSAGVLFYLLSDASVICIGILMFPVLKKYSETIAIAYLSSRLVEAIILIIGGLSLLLLINISQEYTAVALKGTSYYQTLSTLVKKFQGLCYETAFFATGGGGIMLCYLLYNEKLIPRLISVLGIVGYVILFLKSFVDLLGYNTPFALFIPVAIFELVFPLWIIVKGFNASPIVDLKV